MSAIPPAMPVDATSVPSQIDAFRSNAGPDGLQVGMDPNEIGRALIAGLDRFRAQEADFKAATARSISGENTQADAPAAGNGPRGTTFASDPPPPSAAGDNATMGSSRLNPLGLMMQTYSFALEATMVSNAATTFSNSVNTLIKTQ